MKFLLDAAPLRLSLVAAFWCFCLLPFASTGRVLAQLPADRSTNVYLEELEKQQLFGSVIRHCEMQMTVSSVPAGLKSQLAARWIRCLTLQTLALEPSAAAEVWPQVKETANRLVAETQLYPQSSLVRFQAALIGLGEARLASLYPATSTERAPLRERGVEAARQSLNDLRTLNDELLRLAPSLPQRSPANEPFPELNREQMYALARDVEFQSLAAMSVRARFYSENEQASRLDTGQQIIERAAELQPKMSNESLLWWETQYLALEALRNLQEWSQWNVKWQNSPLPLAPQQVLGKLTAARLEALLDQGSRKSPPDFTESLAQANDFFVLLQKRDPQSLLEVKNTADLTHATAWPEFDVARARLYLLLATEADRVASEKSGEKIEVASLGAESQILEFSREVAKQHGSYWSGELIRRLMSRSSPNGAAAAAVSPLLVRQMITDGDWGQVRDLVQTGVRQAVEAKNPDRAFELATLVAGVPKVIGPQAWMIEQIEATALGFPEHPEAAKTHHFANVIASLLAQSQAEYQASAMEVWKRHRTTWPQTESAHKVRLLLAEALRKEGQADLAAIELLEVPASSVSFPAAIKQLTGAIHGLLYDSKLNASQRVDVADHWVKLIRPKLQANGQWLPQWTSDTKLLALLAIQLQLEAQDRQAAWISSLLKIVEPQSPDIDESVRSRFAVVATLVEYEQIAGGTTSLDQLSQLGIQITASDLVWLARALELRLPRLGLVGELELAQAGPNRAGLARRAATIQATVIAQIEAHYPQVADNNRDWLSLQKMASLTFSDRISDAIEIAKTVAGNNDKSLPHQQWLGYCLIRSNHPEDSAAAKRQWRKIGFLTQKNSDDWFEAKYYLAESQRRLGEKDEAAKLLQFVKLTEPQAWQQTPHHAQLERLLKSLASN
ncbi:MAG: hypothetical protein JNL67_11625 [Planctomycetaceae bacterium]|nr:hypothetical protein [Planctomycetaceae bacterium]